MSPAAPVPTDIEIFWKDNESELVWIDLPIIQACNFDESGLSVVRVTVPELEKIGLSRCATKIGAFCRVTWVAHSFPFEGRSYIYPYYTVENPLYVLCRKPCCPPSLALDGVKIVPSKFSPQNGHHDLAPVLFKTRVSAYVNVMSDPLDAEAPNDIQKKSFYLTLGEYR